MSWRHVYFEPKRRNKNDYVNWKQKQYCELFDWGAKIKKHKYLFCFFESNNVLSLIAACNILS